MTAAKPFELVAHRGDKTNAPENTLSAFRRACELDCEAIELDVRLSADGELIVIHDGTLDRTTSGTGAVADQPLAALQALDAGSWFSSDFAGEPLPTLAEAIEAIAGRRLLVVEIKEPPGDTDRAEQLVVSELRNAGIADNALLCSFHAESVVRAQRLAPEIPVSIIGGSGPELLAAAKELNTGHLSLHHAACTPELMAQVKEANLWINTWTLNDEPEMQRVTALGADSLACDRPADMAVWRQALKV